MEETTAGLGYAAALFKGMIQRGKERSGSVGFGGCTMEGDSCLQCSDIVFWTAVYSNQKQLLFIRWVEGSPQNFN